MIDFVRHPEIAISGEEYASGRFKTWYSRDYGAIFADVARGVEKEWDVLRWLFANDLWFLVRYGFGIEKSHHPFVVRMCREVETGPRTDTLDIWARYHWKSTIITQAETLQFEIKNPEKCTGIFCYARPAAKKPLFSLKSILEESELLQWCFPDVLWKRPDVEAPKWSLDDGLVFKRKGSSRKECSIEAHGLIEGMPTGSHFERNVFDDLETDDIRESPDMLNKVYSKFQMASVNLGTGSDSDQTRTIGTYYSHFGPNVKIRDMEYPDGRNVYTLRLVPGSVDGTREGMPVLMDSLSWEKAKMSPHFNCVPSGTQIMTPNGEFNIEDISAGDFVLTHKGRYRRVVHKFIHEGFEGNLFQITTWASNQNGLLLSAEHPIYCLRKEWKCKKDKSSGNRAKDREQYSKTNSFILANEIKKADGLLCPIILDKMSEEQILSHSPVKNNLSKPLSSDFLLQPSFWRFVGYWLAEGLYYRNQSNTRFVLCFSEEKDTEVKKDCRGIIGDILNRSVSTVKGKGAEQLIFCSVELGEFFKEWGSGSLNKKIPFWVEGLPDNCLFEMYKGYLAGDGTIDNKGYEVITSINLEMLQSFQRILNKIGKSSTITIPYLKRNNIINGKKRNCKPFYRLICTNKPKLAWFENGNVVKKVKDISLIPFEGVLYNLEVDEDNSYVANSYSVHNSQQLCDPTPSSEIRLNGSYLKPIEPQFIPRSVYKFMVLDQAGGDETNKQSGDMWSYGVVGIEPVLDDIGQSNVYLMDVEADKMSHSEGIDGVTRMYLRNGMIMQFGVEKVGLSTTEMHISNALRMKGRRLNLEAGNLVLLRPAGRSKEKRVENALQWPLNNGKLFYSTAIPQKYIDAIIEEMQKFPFYHVDILDMWAYAWDLFKEYRFPINRQTVKVVENNVSPLIFGLRGEGLRAGL